MEFSIEQFYNQCSTPEYLVEAMEDANMSGNSNIISSTKALGFSFYGITWSIYLYFLTGIVIFYNLDAFVPIRKVTTCFRWILGTSLISNVTFSLTSTAPYAFMLLIGKWHLGENLCQIFKYLQSLALHFSSMMSIYVMFFHSSPNIFKTKVCVALLTFSSLFCSILQFLIYKSSQKNREGQSYTCEEYGFLMKDEFSAFLIFFHLPIVFIVLIYASSVKSNFEFKDNSWNLKAFRHRLVHYRCVRNRNVFSNLSENLRKNKWMSLYLKFILILFYVIFWTMYHTINIISAFVKPEVLGNQVNNAASLAFGNMLALTSPLILTTFGKIRRTLQGIWLSSDAETELREITTFRNSRGTPSNMLERVCQSNVISAQGTAPKQINNRFRSVIFGPANLSQQCSRTFESIKSELLIGSKSLILLPTHVEVEEESTPSTEKD